MLLRLNGEIHFVMGNHDKYSEIIKMPKFKSVQDYLELRLTHYDETNTKIETLFCMMHYPIYSWNKNHHGSYHLHGHCHGNLHHGEQSGFYINRRVMDVGCMLNDYRPISYSEVIQQLSHIEIEKLTRE
jgi:calcineurin-like phosphoesterase family protein